MSVVNGADILFINPAVGGYDYPHAPLGLAELKAYVQQRGFSAAVYDAWALRATDAELHRAVAATPFRAIGITATSFTMDQVKRIAAIARQAAPCAVLICGGPHPSYDPANFLHFNPAFDAVVYGEGEATLAELLAALDDRPRWAGIAGLAYRNGGGVTVNPARPGRLDLDELPFPDFGAFPIDKYKPHAPYGRRRPFFNLITSRGCPYRCSFCSNAVFGRQVRLKSAGRVFAEVQWAHREFGAREIHFYDDVFTINKERFATFCEKMIRERLPIIWSMTTRVDLIDSEMLRLARRAGCWLVTFGVESGVDEILQRAGKSYTTAQVRSAFAAARRAGLRTHGFFMIGLPGETSETARATIRFAREIAADSTQWSTLFSLPGSALFHETHDSGKEHAYALYDKGMPPHQMYALKREAMRACYLSPAYVLRLLGSVRSWTELSLLVGAGIDVMRSILNLDRKPSA